jgi:hypothetical protein
VDKLISHTGYPAFGEAARKWFRSDAWITISAFGAYFCMYGFRKPYTAATYGGLPGEGSSLKALLILSQTLGYVLSKWIGIRFVSGIRPVRRVPVLILLVGLAEFSLLCFAFSPERWKAFFLFLNGLPLGIVFGLVLSFLEGRRHSEALIAGLCASFILSDGVSKSAGRLLLDLGVSESWMPVLAGLVFALPFLVFTGMLSLVPPPSAKDRAERKERLPMDGASRSRFFIRYLPGLTGLILMYVLVTLLRSIRADFAAEFWRAFGYRQTPFLFTRSEIWVSLGVMLVNGLLIFVPGHRRALTISLCTCISGFGLILLALMGLNHGLDPFVFMVFSGLGVYLPYVAIHTTVFERMVSLAQEPANIGFLMYLADAAGYTAYILLMLHTYVFPNTGWAAPGMMNVAYVVCIAGVLLSAGSLFYLHTRFRAHG